VEDTDTEDKFNVFGRGVLHLSVLIETMRREGYELQVGKPQVIVKEIDGVKCEPYEIMVIDVPEEYLLWLQNKGFPKGRLGELLGWTLEIKIEGLAHLVRSIPKAELAGAGSSG